MRLTLHAAEWLRVDQPKILFTFLERIRTLDPLQPAPELITGDYALLNCDSDEAFYYYDLAIQKAPRNPEAYLARAQWHAWQEDYPRALRDLDEALALGMSHDYVRRVGHFCTGELRGLCRLATDDISGGTDDLAQLTGFASDEYLLTQLEWHCRQFSESVERSPRNITLQRSLELVESATNRLRGTMRVRYPHGHDSPDGRLRWSVEKIEGSDWNRFEIVIHNRSGQELYRIKDSIPDNCRWLVTWGTNDMIWIAINRDSVVAWERTDAMTWWPAVNQPPKNSRPPEMDRFVKQDEVFGWHTTVRPYPLEYFEEPEETDE